MPVLSCEGWQVEFTDQGTGPAVILVHSSVSGNRQWRRLAAALEDRFRILAVNLFGYGHTSPWTGDGRQTLADQARLVGALCDEAGGPVCLVGHSFGGAVAIKAASELGRRVAGLVLLEPNPFYLLAAHGRDQAHEEIRSLRDRVKRCGGEGDWAAAAAPFADYWLGDGAWAEMPEDRQRAFVESLPPVYHEWDAVMHETVPLDEWSAIAATTLLVQAAQTKRPIAEIAELLRSACPHWRFVELPAGGHMAPLTRPDLVNPVVAEFLDEVAASGSAASAGDAGGGR